MDVITQCIQCIPVDSTEPVLIKLRNQLREKARSRILHDETEKENEFSRSMENLKEQHIKKMDTDNMTLSRLEEELAMCKNEEKKCMLNMMEGDLSDQVLRSNVIKSFQDKKWTAEHGAMREKFNAEQTIRRVGFSTFLDADAVQLDGHMKKYQEEALARQAAHEELMKTIRNDAVGEYRQGKRKIEEAELIKNSNSRKALDSIRKNKKRVLEEMELFITSL